MALLALVFLLECEYNKIESAGEKMRLKFLDIHQCTTINCIS